MFKQPTTPTTEIGKLLNVMVQDARHRVQTMTETPQVKKAPSSEIGKLLNLMVRDAKRHVYALRDDLTQTTLPQAVLPLPANDDRKLQTMTNFISNRPEIVQDADTAPAPKATPSFVLVDMMRDNKAGITDKKPVHVVLHDFRMSSAQSTVSSILAPLKKISAKRRRRPLKPRVTSPQDGTTPPSAKILPFRRPVQPGA